MTFGGPGSWIARVDELRGEIEQSKVALRAERRATTQAHKHFFDFLEEIGETDAFVAYLKRAQGVTRRAA